MNRLPERLRMDIDDAAFVTFAESVVTGMEDFALRADVADFRVDPDLAHAVPIEIGVPGAVHERMRFARTEIRDNMPRHPVPVVIVAEIHDPRDACGIVRRVLVVLASWRGTHHQGEIGDQKDAAAPFRADFDAELA